MNSVDLTAVEQSFRAGRSVIHAVRGIDLTITAGEPVALLGPNGAGKSTTVDLILGLTRPDRGRVALLDRWPRVAVEQGLVGAMLQAGALMRDVSGRELSGHGGGETQRVRFALAVICVAAVLLLDKPTVGMRWRRGGRSGPRCARSPRAARPSSSPRSTRTRRRLSLTASRSWRAAAL